MKNPGLAFVLGFVFPPLGLFYVRRYFQAFFFLLLEFFGVMAIFVGGLGLILLFVFALYCGFYCQRQARKINDRTSARAA